MQLSKEEYTRKRIHNDSSVQIENSVTRVNVRRHLASLVIPNSYPCDGIFYPHLTTIKDSYIPDQGLWCLPFCGHLLNTVESEDNYRKFFWCPNFQKFYSSFFSHNIFFSSPEPKAHKMSSQYTNGSPFIRCPHIWTWISRRPDGQSWSNFICSITGEKMLWTQ